MKDTTRINLTGADIHALAMFAGFAFDAEPTQDELESEYAIECKDGGFESTNDDGVTERYERIAYSTEYPEEGCIPLGNKLP